MDVLLASQEVLCFMELVSVCTRTRIGMHMHALIYIVLLWQLARLCSTVSMCNISDGHFLTANMSVYHHL
jgi:hypothetical protein